MLCVHATASGRQRAFILERAAPRSAASEMPELTEQQERLAREWLEKLKPALGIEALDRNKNKGGATQDEDGRKTASRGGGGLADVSDDECELEGGADEGASSRGSSGRKKDDPAVRAGDAFIKVRPPRRPLQSNGGDVTASVSSVRVEWLR